MISLLIGIASFILFFLADYLSYAKKNPKFGNLFYVASVLLVFSTLIVVLKNKFVVSIGSIIFAILAIASFVMLLYTLFFALGKEAYSYSDDGKIPLTCTGVYALCRHPGVVFLSAFYLFFCAIFPSAITFLMFFIYTLLDILYVYWQDSYLFEKTISGYEKYKLATPFLIPTRHSIKQAFGKYESKK